LRFDDVAGRLRTPAGGSSRQVTIVVDSPKVQSRLISSRDTARLMGPDDAYELPENYNEAYGRAHFLAADRRARSDDGFSVRRRWRGDDAHVPLVTEFATRLTAGAPAPCRLVFPIN